MDSYYLTLAGLASQQLRILVSGTLETRQTNQTQLRPSFARAHAPLAYLTYLLAAINQLFGEQAAA